LFFSGFSNFYYHSINSTFVQYLSKDFYSSTDWIIKTQGKEITEWADWGVGGTITYDGDYTIHTSGTYNFYIDTIFPLINFYISYTCNRFSKQYKYLC